jgi:hypothetical protein
LKLVGEAKIMASGPFGQVGLRKIIPDEIKRGIQVSNFSKAEHADFENLE